MAEDVSDDDSEDYNEDFTFNKNLGKRGACDFGGKRMGLGGICVNEGVPYFRKVKFDGSSISLRNQKGGVGYDDEGENYYF